jgi:hypothetical protein
VFYFQQLLNIALSGIDATSIIPTVTNIAYGILLLGFLVALYHALIRSGDVQALGVAAIKYLVVAIIVANWSSLFREINSSFNDLAQYIGNSSGAGDMFMSWLNQLNQQMTNSNTSFWDLITGDLAALIGALLIIVAYIVYAVAVIIFCFFYSLYGSVLYVLGPLILALLPMAGVGQLARSFATNLMIWNAWGIIYATMGALITAIQVNQVSQVGGGGFLGFLRGPFDSLIVGLVSIFFALAIAVIPFIAKRIISGDVGATARALVQTALTAGGVAVAGVAGFGAGASTGTAGAGSTAGSGAAGSSGGGSGAAVTSASSAAPAPPSTAGESIRAGLVSAVNGNSSPGAPASSSSGASDQDAGGSSSGSASSGSSTPRSTYRPRGVTQTLMYGAGKTLGEHVRGKR